MTNPNLSAVRWIDLDASLVSACSWCQHSEFIHTDAGPCLFCACKCPRFFPTVDRTDYVEPAARPGSATATPSSVGAAPDLSAQVFPA